MSHELNRNCNRVLALVVTVLPLVPLAVHGAPTTKSTTWTITVDVTSGATQPQYQLTYSPDASHGGCKYANASADPNKLQVCPTDNVVWQGKSQGQQHDLVIFVSDGLLTDNGNATKTFHEKDGNPTDTGAVSSSAALGSPYEVYVALFDRKNNKMHNDDPQIIVGTGQLLRVTRLANEIVKDALQLNKLLPDNPQAKKLLDDAQGLKSQLTKP